MFNFFAFILVAGGRSLIAVLSAPAGALRLLINRNKAGTCVCLSFRTPNYALGRNSLELLATHGASNWLMKLVIKYIKLSPHYSAEVKNEWSYTSNPLYAFMACIGTLYFTFTYII